VLRVFPLVAFPLRGCWGREGRASSLDLFHAILAWVRETTETAGHVAAPRAGNQPGSFLRRRQRRIERREEQLNQLKILSASAL